MSRIVAGMLYAALCLALWSAQADEPPPVMLAEVHHLGEPIDLPAYRVSEKFDGVRAWWTGERLITRSGQVIATPDWFVAGWPRAPLDGELWAGRGRFDLASGIARREAASDDDWRAIEYRVFDLPAAAGDFDARTRALATTIEALHRPWVVAVEQRRVASADQLERLLADVVTQGGEGLMLKRGDSPYRAGRGRDLLKLKPLDDAEAIVVGYEDGQGKYTGLVGALVVRSADGRQFRIGSGLSDADRRSPPAPGTRVTYAYSGLTAKGLPRFARYLRARPPE